MIRPQHDIIDAPAEAEQGYCLLSMRPRSIGEQMAWLYDAQRAAERAAVAERGQTAVDEGGWREVALYVLTVAPAWITPGAKAEYLRSNGIERPRKRVEPPADG